MDVGGKASTIGELLGGTSNTSFDKAIQYHWQGDTSTVSIAGQVIKDGGNLIINLRDQGVCYHLMKTCLTFELSIPPSAVIFNIIQLFALTSIQLGNLSWSFGGT